MKLIANRINGIHLRDILLNISNPQEVESVLAAIAYGSNASNIAQDLVGHSVANKLRLDLWMRYDHTVPVSVELLKRLLKHQKENVTTRFIPDCFHPKIIWWKGYGAYIGSANHTDNGWMTNIEVGVFLTDDELIANGMDNELDEFFEYLNELKVSIPISSEYVAEMERMNELNKNAYAEAKKIREHEEWQGSSFSEKKSGFERKKGNFRTEWLNTMAILRGIEEQLSEYRPSWVTESVPSGWQVDQFLHAYYYNKVGDGLSKPYEEYFQRNKDSKNLTLKAALEWWKSLKSAPSHEDEAFYQHAPKVRELLAEDKILDLSVKEFEIICSKTHATMDHIIKVPLAVLGHPELTSMDKEGRLKLFAPLIMRERNSKGWDVRKLLHYVLYGGAPSDIWQRLYHAGRDNSYTISRYGLNSIAEVAGWARPEIAPPRNGRTSKALRALGFNVKVY
ncbi:phosphatidylserine/phosphatidylglycerophosphate/cardiolipin synthase family protein [Pseudomonas moorei]|nr:phosphatidylserine/phosphatidylglycerophosphate/cardiolipin synthase family protein [Pseudomonas moorei]